MKNTIASVFKSPPGTTQAIRLVSDDGREYTWIAKGDAFDVYHADSRNVVALSCSAKHAVKLAWFILWSYWVRGTWFGLKMRLWDWSHRPRTLPARPLP